MLAPVWPQLERLLRADIAVRARTITTDGLSAMAGALHPNMRWSDGAVRVRLRRHSEDVNCRGSGLVLVPSVMSSWGCMVITEAPAQPTLFYPARGVTAGWARDSAELEDALGALLGPARAGILLRAHVARTTTAIAKDAGIAASPPTGVYPRRTRLASSVLTMFSRWAALPSSRGRRSASSLGRLGWRGCLGGCGPASGGGAGRLRP